MTVGIVINISYVMDVTVSDNYSRAMSHPRDNMTIAATQYVRIPADISAAQSANRNYKR